MSTARMMLSKDPKKTGVYKRGEQPGTRPREAKIKEWCERSEPSVQVMAAPRQETKRCLRSPRGFIHSRDTRIDTLLTSHVPAVAGGNVWVTDAHYSEGIDLSGIARILVGSNAALSTLQGRLIDENFTFSPVQVLELIERTVRREEVGMLLDHRANLFLIHDESRSVFGLRIWEHRGWYISIHRFKQETARSERSTFTAKFRLFARNHYVGKIVRVAF